MPARTWGRKGRPWTRVQARVYAEETHCYFSYAEGSWCPYGDGYVDQAMPNYRDKRARSVHHLVPPDIDRSLANKREFLRLAHLGCNSSAGRGIYGQPRATRGARQGQGTRPRTHARRRTWVTPPRAVTYTSERDW